MVTMTVAIAAMPSPVPVKPIPSVVVALKATGQPTACDIIRSASIRLEPIRGRLPISTTLAFTGIT